MRKIALLLAALMLLGMLAACNPEEEKTPDHVVPGYAIDLFTGEGWTVAEESEFDMQLSKDGVTIYIMAFTAMDFVDMPSMEDLYLDCNDELFEEMSELSVKEKETTYEKDGKKIVSTLFSAKSGEETRQYYCFGLGFSDDAQSVAWICFSATEKVMKKQMKSLKAIAEQTEADGEYVSPEEFAQELEEALQEQSEQEEPDYGEMEMTPEYETEPSYEYEGSALEEDVG